MDHIENTTSCGSSVVCVLLGHFLAMAASSGPVILPSRCRIIASTFSGQGATLIPSQDMIFLRNI
jgi:hypothetical protein